MEHAVHLGTRPSRRGVLSLLVALGSLAAIYAVGFDPPLHELMHDARHLLGVPCH